MQPPWPTSHPRWEPGFGMLSQHWGLHCSNALSCLSSAHAQAPQEAAVLRRHAAKSCGSFSSSLPKPRTPEDLFSLWLCCLRLLMHPHPALCSHAQLCRRPGSHLSPREVEREAQSPSLVTALPSSFCSVAQASYYCMRNILWKNPFCLLLPFCLVRQLLIYLLFIK